MLVWWRNLWAAAGSGGQLEQALGQLAEFLLGRPAGQSLLDFGPQHLALQRLALVGVRRAARLAVPGALATVDQLFLRPLPGPHLDQGVHPQVEVEAALVAVDV